MNKYIKVLAVLLVVLCSGEVFACGEKQIESITGGACSILELNKLEKSKETMQPPVLSEGKDLRPVRKTPVINKLDDNECLLGTCLYRIIVEKETR